MDRSPPFHGGSTGSNPVGVTNFFSTAKTNRIDIDRPHRLMDRSPPFHGGSTGSNPVGVTSQKSASQEQAIFVLLNDYLMLLCDFPKIK